MKSRSLVSSARLGLFLGVLSCCACGLGAQDWPSFRGPGALGVSDDQDLPVRWNVEQGENVRFRVEVPGLGHSSPVIAGERIFLTSAVAERVDELRLGDTGGIDMAEDGEQSWLVLALDKSTGERLWSTQVASAQPRAGRHVKSSHANSTPVTEGRTVVAVLGSQGLFAFDAASGERRWQVELGILDPGLFGDSDSHWGYASSPVIHEGRVFVQVDRHADSFLAAYALADGRELWRVERDEMPVWATPTVHAGERDELIVVGGRHVTGYRLNDGEELWRFADEAEVKTPTPFVVGDTIVFSGGYRGRPLYALRLGGEGDLSVSEGVARSEHLLWRSESGGPYTSTPVAYRGRLYFVRDTGILTVVDLESGEFLHRERLDETFSASPVASDGHVYLAGEGGTLIVVTAEENPEIVARNDMGEALMATPAISDGVLYVRGRSSLWALEREGEPSGSALPGSEGE